jgi:hypothetical protein
MGNILQKKELDPLEAAKKKARDERHNKLKAKRTSVLHTKEWDPSGCGDQGPTVIEQDHATGYKEQKVKRASIVVTKTYDPSGTDEQGPAIIRPDHATGWKGAIEEDVSVSEEQKKNRRGSKMRRASHMQKEKVRRASQLPQVGQVKENSL